MGLFAATGAIFEKLGWITQVVSLEYLRSIPVGWLKWFQGQTGLRGRLGVRTAVPP